MENKLSLKFQNFEKGKSYWKFNNTLLKDPEYVKTIKEKIKEIKEQYIELNQTEDINTLSLEEIRFSVNDQLFLETLLMEIRGKTISYSSFKKKKQDKTEQTLIREITNLEESYDIQNEDTLQDKKRELLEIRQKKLEGVKIRSRARWVEEGEKTSNYFCNLENRNFVSKMMPALDKGDGTFATTQEEILNATKDFYESLYSTREVDDIDLNNLLNFNDIPKLNDEQRASLEGKITKEETLLALKNMSNNKSPGSDGFTTEFFKFFWQDIGTFVIRSINTSFDLGELSTTQKEGIITCLPKGDKPKQFLKNWRPISLLNVTYKLASAVIANRIKTVLPFLINTDQTGFIAGRYIGENIRILYDLLNHTEKNDIPALILLIDFEKAFDSVAWSFIHKVLNFFNFGDCIKKWITTFYNNTKSCVIVNGHTSRWFYLGRGCRQGDPLSPYIFILCAEILAHMIRKNPDVKGIKINGKKYLITQYADDTTLFLETTEKSLKNALNIITYYAKFSGLSMNIEKTKVVWIGSMKGSRQKLCQQYNLNWEQNTFTVLGVKFSTNLSEIVNLNYTEKIREIKNLLIQWSKRNLTPFGKITVLKSLVISKINHLILSLPNPTDRILQELNSLFFKFIWNGSIDKIKRKISIKDYKEGGLRMVDISTFVHALKLTWVRRLMLNSSPKWAHILITECSGIMQFSYLGNDYTKKNLKKLNPFWKDVFNAWLKYIDCQQLLTAEDFLKEPIWHNSKFKIGNKSIFSKVMFDAGIIFVNDLIKDDGSVLSFNEFTVKYTSRPNVLFYNGIVLSIMHYRRNNNIDVLEKQLESPLIPVLTYDILKEKKGCRSLYQTLSRNYATPTSRGKWEREFGVISGSEWNKFFQLSQKLTTSSYSKWFQLRILHRILATNTFLFRINIRDNNKCTFCTSEPESLVHLFYDCPHVKIFWLNLFQWLQEECPHINTINLSPRDILFGIIDNRGVDLTFNFIILIAKQFIYKCKRSNQRLLLIQQYKLFLKAVYETEKYIAFKNCSWSKFNTKWSSYKNMMSNIQ